MEKETKQPKHLDPKHPAYKKVAAVEEKANARLKDVEKRQKARAAMHSSKSARGRI